MGYGQPPPASAQTFMGPSLLSAPHPAALRASTFPASRGFAEKGKGGLDLAREFG
jgi:hypothetical protein